MLFSPRKTALHAGMTAVATLTALALTAPAATAAPVAAPGCTFDRTTGQTTCVATQSIAGSEASQYIVDNGANTDGSVGAAYCLAHGGTAQGGYDLVGVVYVTTATTTTTKTYQGIKTGNGGKLIKTTTTTSDPVRTGVLSYNEFYCS